MPPTHTGQIRLLFERTRPQSNVGPSATNNQHGKYGQASFYSNGTFLGRTRTASTRPERVADCGVPRAPSPLIFCFPPVQLSLSVCLPAPSCPLSRGLAAPTGRAAPPFAPSSPGPSPPTSTHPVRPPHLVPSRCAKLSAPKLLVFGSDPIRSCKCITTGKLRFLCKDCHPWVCPCLGASDLLVSASGYLLKRRIRFVLE